MARFREFCSRLWRTLFFKKADEDFHAELESHLAMEVEEGVARGLTEQEARRQALIRHGGLEQAKISQREQRGLPFLETLFQDLHFGLRVFGRNKGFSVIVIMTLAVGIGANTSLFSIVHAVLLRPLPYAHPEELVTVDASKPNFSRGSISYLNFLDWQRENKSLASFAIFRNTSFSITGIAVPERVRAQYISVDFFKVLGIEPALGRLFLSGEDEAGRAPIALISSSLWLRRFQADPRIVGQQIHLDGKSFTVIGVLPAVFEQGSGYFQAKDVYVPIGQWPNGALRDRGAGLGLHGIARLKKGISFSQAQQDMLGVSDRLAELYPKENHGLRAALLPLETATTGEVRPLLLVLLGAVGFVLLIACGNVANLLLARSDARLQEFSVRFALGARRLRIIRQLMTESILLSLAGGTVGLVFAAWGIKAALALLPNALPRSGGIHLNGPVLIFTLALSVAVGMAFGIFPALKISQTRLHGALKEGRNGGGTSRWKAQHSLVIFETALAMVLLVGAGLMTRCLLVLSGVHPGFNTKGVLAFVLSTPRASQRGSSEDIRAYFREAHRRIRETPGIEAASVTVGSSPMDSDDEQLFWLEGEAKPQNSNDMHWSLSYTVEPEYLQVMGIPLLQGRFFTEADNERSQRVVVVDDVLANTYFKGVNPIGQHLNLDGGDQKATVIGVVGHVLQWGPERDRTNSLRAQLYLPFMQREELLSSLNGSLSSGVVVRTSQNTSAIVAALQNNLRKMDREQVLWGVSSMDQVLRDSMAERRFTMILLSLFAVLALGLASVGIYGVLSFLVGRKTREIGIRMALGADRGVVLRWVLGQGGRLIATGILIGGISAVLLIRVISAVSLVDGVRGYDPYTLLSVTGILAFVGCLASFVPAARAMRIEPIRALRSE